MTNRIEIVEYDPSNIQYEKDLPKKDGTLKVSRTSVTRTVVELPDKGGRYETELGTINVKTRKLGPKTKKIGSHIYTSYADQQISIESDLVGGKISVQLSSKDGEGKLDLDSHKTVYVRADNAIAPERHYRKSWGI